MSADDVQDMQEAVENAPACDELYAEGNVLEEGQHQEPCAKDDGEVTFLGTASEECDDGRKLLWNDAAWWFEGEPVNPHPAGSDANVPPDSAYRDCGG